MRSASSFRRAGGVLAAAALGMSTAVLGSVGVAHAAPGPQALTASTPLTVPAGACTIEWVLSGAPGGDSSSFVGGAGDRVTVWMAVLPGEEYVADRELEPGGSGGTGGGNGGDGIGLIVDGELIAVAAGGGGAGSASNGGAAGQAGEQVPSSDGVADDWYAGGDFGTTEAAGLGGVLGTEVPTGTPGGDGVDNTGGNAGGPGAGGGGGGLYGGGAGASNGTDGAGGGGGSSEYDEYDEVGTSTGPASITYEYLECDGTEMPLAPADLQAAGGDEKLTVSFVPQWHADGGEDPETWEYQIGAGSWTPVEPDVNSDNEFEFVIDELVNGTPYTVNVRGVSVNGVDGAPASVTGTPYLPIGAPGNVQVSTSGTTVTFRWDAPTTPGTFALDGYVAVLAANYGQSGGPVWYCMNTATQRVCEATAPPGVDYQVFVTAIDAEGNDGGTAGPVTVGKLALPATVPTADGPLQAPPGAAGGVGQGESITLTGSGYGPNSLVTILMYSTPQVLTAVWTDGSGSFTVEVTVPAGLPVGRHTLVAAGVDPSGVMRYLTLPVDVTETTAVLAYTGADIALPALGGLAALAVGGGLLVAGRRRPVPAAVEQE